MSIKILMIVTSAFSMGPGGNPTGVWFEEVATPYYAFADAGAEVTIASISGGETPVDPNSVKPAGENEASVERFLADSAASGAMRAAVKLSGVDISQYDAVFLPGGHGTMWDLPNDAGLAAMLSSAWAQGKVIAAVCHGPAGLVNVTDAAGKPIVAGRRVTSFTDAEERAAGLEKVVPFLLETRIRALGARFENGGDFQPFALADGRLVTGQNPASSALTASLVLKAIKAKAGQ